MRKLLVAAQALNSRFPEGNTPFQIVTRLGEECGELAKEVKHFERTGRKIEKHGPPYVKWSSYLLFAEVALSDNDITAAISGIRAGKALAQKEMEVRPPFLFDRLTNALVSRNSDVTDLEWFLQNIVSDKFSALRGNDDYEQIVKSTIDDIADAKS